MCVKPEEHIKLLLECSYTCILVSCTSEGWNIHLKLATICFWCICQMLISDGSVSQMLRRVCTHKVVTWDSPACGYQSDAAMDVMHISHNRIETVQGHMCFDWNGQRTISHISEPDVSLWHWRCRLRSGDHQLAVIHVIYPHTHLTTTLAIRGSVSDHAYLSGVIDYMWSRYANKKKKTSSRDQHAEALTLKETVQTNASAAEHNQIIVFGRFFDKSIFSNNLSVSFDEIPAYPRPLFMFYWSYTTIAHHGCCAQHTVCSILSSHLLT